MHVTEVKLVEGITFIVLLKEKQQLLPREYIREQNSDRSPYDPFNYGAVQVLSLTPKLKDASIMDGISNILAVSLTISTAAMAHPLSGLNLVNKHSAYHCPEYNLCQKVYPEISTLFIGDPPEKSAQVSFLANPQTVLQTCNSNDERFSVLASY
ncbi:hypothetical protein E5288_WYG021460 [Bos mutus]|uniref:Uncharacterized protein n=1 Tax=Bos mutus TaxID=72004 RepID=A0A6B0RBL1_9CETA|nr:hypothetical protein [Bos mutus]